MHTHTHTHGNKQHAITESRHLTICRGVGDTGRGIPPPPRPQSPGPTRGASAPGRSPAEAFSSPEERAPGTVGRFSPLLQSRPSFLIPGQTETAPPVRTLTCRAEEEKSQYTNRTSWTVSARSDYLKKWPCGTGGAEPLTTGVCVCVCVCERVCGKTADQTGRAGPRRLRLELLLDWLSGAEPPFRGVSGGARRVIRDFC